ncbi:helix-turn-helix domain protein [Planomonospora sphaerica]|uniref:Helix-turn-helix domain protein n=1 Tax=Planomonospora sphaerica TaxID=161355 RepID=A0A171DJ63_9ACTN|nr:helix-turn-helix domain protein [Planomonospora sphaerica]
MNDELWTAEEAAAEVGVKPGTIHAWVHRGYLTPQRKRGGAHLFRLEDVFAAEAGRKRKHRRKVA